MPIIRKIQKHEHINEINKIVGWQKDNKGLRGEYRTSHGTWNGTIFKLSSGHHYFYIFNPPEELKNHPHWPNFHYIGKNWHRIYFSTRQPKNYEEGIRIIEQILKEALERKY